MKPTHALWLLGLSIVCSGCALVEDASRNLYVAFSTPVEVHREKARNEKWAEDAWQVVCSRDGLRSDDFAQGFKDGFAEYLFRGGSGEPPLMAPLRYRHIRYQNPQGYQAIQAWFDGYRLGTATARDSGARRWITGPSALQYGFHDMGVPDGPLIVPVVPAPPRPRPAEGSPLQPPTQMLPHETSSQNLRAPARLDTNVPNRDGRGNDGESVEPEMVRVKITEVQGLSLPIPYQAEPEEASPLSPAQPQMVPQETTIEILNLQSKPGFGPPEPVERAKVVEPAENIAEPAEPDVMKVNITDVRVEPLPDEVRVRILAIKLAPEHDE